MITESQCDVGQLITFNMLPEDVLLEIIDFCVGRHTDGEHIVCEGYTVEWIRLAHVCRRWRSIIFQSPHRLNLRLICKKWTPARDTLDIWPPLPLVIHDKGSNNSSDTGNIIAALEHSDRVYHIDLDHSSPDVMNSAAMQKPFPELTHLRIVNFGIILNPLAIIPNSFMGGAAPRLRSLYLLYFPFPGLPKLLCSAAHLVHLALTVPKLGYIPPKLMATSLSALTNLKFFLLHFMHPTPRLAPESRLPPPPSLTRSILSSLTEINFIGTSEYLEVILAHIDAPRLHDLDIAFFNQIIFHTPQLSQLISRRPTFMEMEKGCIRFSYQAVAVKSPSLTSAGKLKVEILSRVLEWQLSFLEQVCTSSFPPVSTLKDLYIYDITLGSCWRDDVENTLWLELLRPFAAVKNLYICRTFVPRIAPALQELVGSRTTEALPTLENIFLDGFRVSEPLHKGIEKFVAARGLISHPIAVYPWDSPTFI